MYSFFHCFSFSVLRTEHIILSYVFFFSRIYLFSDGFHNDSYDTSDFHSSLLDDQNRPALQDACLLYGIHSKSDGDSITYTGYIKN